MFCCCCVAVVVVVFSLFSFFLLLIFRVWENEKNDSNFNFPSAIQYVCVSVCVFIYTHSHCIYRLHHYRKVFLITMLALLLLPPMLLRLMLVTIVIVAVAKHSNLHRTRTVENKTEGNYTINQPYMKFVEITKSI